MITAHDIAVSFGLKKRGREFRGTCPICQACKLELAVWEDAGKIRCKCFYGACDGMELFQILVGTESYHATPIIKATKSTELDRIAWAQDVWRETILSTGTLVAQYLRNRSITLPIPADIRFHCGLKHAMAGEIFPAMVAAVRNIRGEIRAIHRTFLNMDGHKARVDTPKMSAGPILGCAIQLAEAGETLGLAEGIETALSAMQMSELPIWCAVSAGNMKRLELPECVREVVIFGDNGGPGASAARDAAAVFDQEGRKVRIAFPPESYGDFNDLLTKGSKL